VTDKMIKAYLGLTFAFVFAGVFWMVEDSVRNGVIGRAPISLFLTGMLMLFLPITIGSTTEYIQKRRKRKEEQNGI